MHTYGLALTGFEDATTRQLAALLSEPGAEPRHWRLTGEAEADVVMVDADTLGGHMTWLKLVGAGRITVACSATPVRPEATSGTLHLCLPATADSLGAVLAHARAKLQPAASAIPAQPTTGAPAAASHVPSAGAPKRVCDLLLDDAGLPLRIEAGERSIVIDPQLDRWYGENALKPLTALLHSPAHAAMTPDPAALTAARAGTGQPLARLRWFAALLADPGALPQGARAESRLRLTRWPEIEREFPRHFRIASALLRHPATVAEIAEQTGVEPADVADFARAAQVRGMLEVLPPAAAPDAAQPMLAARR